jgi:hypothetical protein
VRSHYDAYRLYEIARRTKTLDGCRVVAKLVCSNGHSLGTVHMIEGKRVVAMTIKVQEREVDPAISLVERKLGQRIVPRTRKMLIVDLLDETDPNEPRPLLRGDCACRPSPRAVTREWLLDTCVALDRNAVRSRRVVLR